MRPIDADKLKSEFDITNWGNPYGCSFSVIDRQPTIDDIKEEDDDCMAKWATGTQPKKKGRYLVTYNSSFGRQVRQADRTEYPKGYWHWTLLPYGNASVPDKDIIAWQKCPDPYKG